MLGKQRTNHCKSPHEDKSGNNDGVRWFKVEQVLKQEHIEFRQQRRHYQRAHQQEPRKRLDRLRRISHESEKIMADIHGTNEHITHNKERSGCTS